MTSRVLSAFLRAALEVLLRLLAVLAILCAGLEPERAEASQRLASPRRRDTHAAPIRPRDGRELVQRLRVHGL
jgi:hypothetical protein